MNVKLEFLSNDGNPCERDALGDAVIRAIDRVMKGATWKKSKSGTAWVAEQ